MAVDDDHRCGLCGKSFDTEEDLKEHAKKEHQNQL